MSIGPSNRSEEVRPSMMIDRCQTGSDMRERAVKFKSFLLGHKILKSTSVDCNKINVVMVNVRIMMWESPGDSHAIAIQWVHMVKDPLATILHVHTVAIKYTAFLSIMIGI